MPLKKENKNNSIKNERKPVPQKRKTAVPTAPLQPAVKKLKSSVVEKKKEDTPVSGWTVKELCELTRKIENNIPVNDDVPVKANKTLHSLDWNLVRVGQHSVEECKNAWSRLQRRIRSYRTLKEIVQALREDIYANNLQGLEVTPLSFFLREKRIETCGEKGTLTDEAIRQFKSAFHQLPKAQKEKYEEICRNMSVLSSKKTKKTESTEEQQDS